MGKTIVLDVVMVNRCSKATNVPRINEDLNIESLCAAIKCSPPNRQCKSASIPRHRRGGKKQELYIGHSSRYLDAMLSWMGTTQRGAPSLNRKRQTN